MYPDEEFLPRYAKVVLERGYNNCIHDFKGNTRCMPPDTRNNTLQIQSFPFQAFLPGV